jgi:hypothetical protein
MFSDDKQAQEDDHSDEVVQRSSTAAAMIAQTLMCCLFPSLRALAYSQATYTMVTQGPNPASRQQ